jgi:hypothetical protein
VQESRKVLMLNRQSLGSSQPEGVSPDILNAINNEDFSLATEGADLALAFPDVIQHAPKKNQSWRWLLVALLSCCAAGGVAIGAFVWLINLPPTTNCENKTTLTTDRAELYCAQIAAGSGDLEDVLDSLTLVAGWDSGHPLHYEVQPLVERWSWVALQAAQDKLRDSDMDGAIALINHIPAFSPVYPTAQATLQSWNSEWDQGAAMVAEAQAALKQQDWATASKQVLALSELKNAHWRIDQVQALSQQIRVERQAQRQLTEAVALASPGGSDRLGAAMRKVSQIDESTYARQAAQPYLDRWSDLLLKLGKDKWYAAELDTAIAIGRNVALNDSRAKAAQELIWISQARKLARQSLSDWRTSPRELAQLYQAMMLANRIPVDSPYYPQAKSSIATWKTHLHDLTQLQVAQLAGRVQTLDTLRLAIASAQQIPPGHPRRVQAQTLIAHWQQEMQNFEDRPILIKARQLADGSTIEAYEAAIQMASQIPLHRALRGEAQSWIYVWESEIEALQDRPILESASILAADEKFSQAIAEASNIHPGRVLYDEAQANIAQWSQRIATIEQSRQRRSLPTTPRPKPESPDADPNASADNSPSTIPAITPTTPSRSRSSSNPTPAIAPAPAAVSPDPTPAVTAPGRSRSNALPASVEAVPTISPTAQPAAPIESSPPEQPVIPSLPREAQAPSPLQAPAETTAPAPITAPPPVVAPVPIPAAISEPDIAVPVAPAPQPINIAPPPVTDISAPEPVPAVVEPQTAKPVAPSVSAQPQPEQLVSLAPSTQTEVLYTGALYAGL